MPDLSYGSHGPDVRELQELLCERGYAVAVDGDFGGKTRNAVKAFQSQNLDQLGQPLVVDGKVGPLTWWSLTHRKPLIETVAAVDYGRMPPQSAGGSRFGRAALKTAINELNLGAGEEGGNNKGKWVRKYLNGLAPEGSSWCAAFTSWCYSHNSQGMPFTYSVGARDILKQFKDHGWTHEPNSGYSPEPGDIVVWWRVQASGWQGHIGLVHSLKDGILYTIEGNKSPKVQGFSYVLSRMEKLLGFGQVPG
ncbi:MAG: CHAP domain-containing protein [Calditrichaeota bacterium]|nr:CHAP domain-containing protein [Calditrichota bacterium]MCB9369713.1 CHAP domain-containing protein [Calditrichota bacterium]